MAKSQRFLPATGFLISEHMVAGRSPGPFGIHPQFGSRGILPAPDGCGPGQRSGSQQNAELPEEVQPIVKAFGELVVQEAQITTLEGVETG